MTWSPTKAGKQEKIVFSEADIERFNGRFEKRSADECWPWNYVQGHAGHGRMWAGGRNTLASHIALHLDGRPRIERAAALHSCDNPRCVNPSHLRWGTQLENIADRVTRNRDGAAHGEANGSAKLTVEQVVRIRADTRTSRTIAPEYGISQAMVCNIKAGRAWRHVGELATEAGRETDMPAVFAHTKEEARTVSVGLIG